MESSKELKKVSNLVTFLNILMVIGTSCLIALITKAVDVMIVLNKTTH